MPYVEQERRYDLDSVVDEMVKAHVEVNGDLNYILYYYCKDFIIPSYNNYKNFIGELNECAAEIRRRILAPYEDEKIKENGDI